MLIQTLTHLFAAGGGASLLYLLSSFWKSSPLRDVVKKKLHDQLETLGHAAVDKMVDAALSPAPTTPPAPTPPGK